MSAEDCVGCKHINNCLGDCVGFNQSKRMTNEEYKQFINEYCRNVGNIKIKCDDCKFVEDCVDYGWQECKKFTPKPSEPMTNEEYIKSLNTEQLARILHKMTIACYCCGKDGRIDEKPSHCVFGRCTGEKDILEWLKQPYEE